MEYNFHSENRKLTPPDLIPFFGEDSLILMEQISEDTYRFGLEYDLDNIEITGNFSFYDSKDKENRILKLQFNFKENYETQIKDENDHSLKEMEFYEFISAFESYISETIQHYDEQKNNLYLIQKIEGILIEYEDFDISSKIYKCMNEYKETEDLDNIPNIAFKRIRDDCGKKLCREGYLLIHELESSLRQLITKICFYEYNKEMFSKIPPQILNKTKLKKHIDDKNLFFLYDSDFIDIGEYLCQEYATTEKTYLCNILENIDTIKTDELVSKLKKMS